MSILNLVYSLNSFFGKIAKSCIFSYYNIHEDLSAEKKKKKANTRVFEAAAHAARQTRLDASAQKKAKPAYGMTKMNVLLVMRKGKRFFGSTVDITVMKRSDKNPSVAKVVVSQKVAKKAVDRHKIQRRLREIMHHILKTNLLLSRGFDIVLVARPPAHHTSFNDLQKSVEDVLARLP